MGWYKKISNNCKKATFLIDKKNLEGINPLQHIELRIHLMGCSFCRLYNKQSEIINHLVWQFRQNNLPEELNEEFKKTLEENIALQLKKS
jgi:hypothetical protein